MRLFIAINFDKETNSYIGTIRNKIKKSSIEGKFVQDEHMHLTLEFLGDIEEKRVHIIKDIMGGIGTKPFTLRLSRLGYFRRRDGDIYWLGIEDNETLYALQKRLHKKLLDHNFRLENRPYKPHITIGRRVKMIDSFDPISLASEIQGIINVDKIGLVKSEHIKGGLTYSILYTKNLSP